MQETQVQSLGWEDPLEKGMATHFSILSGEFHGQRSLVGCSPWSRKESGKTEHLSTATLNLYVEDLTSSISECDCIWRYGL